ncbi:MAG: hypothetical protein DI630_00570 [Gordonia sp. (in: high G+C Gram-positive bacteria)]|nr:MAG: hypothetical protein DI630_00570 [Gordonia sp. (in: high G+C Gram-positive bacteria)]
MDKPIKLAGFSAATPLARQLITSKPGGMISMEQVPMLAVFTLESTTLDFVGNRHVPQFRLMGRLDRLIPENPEDMPYGIGEIGLSEEESIRVVGDYPFNVEQLGVLVEKGLYLEGFGPPESLEGLPFEVDTRIDLQILPPNREGAPPLVIADLSPMHSFDMRLETSRYELAAYFPDHRQALIDAGKITGNEALGVETEHTSSQPDLSNFSFADEIDLSSVIGRDGKSAVERLSALLEVDLSAPKALRDLREDTRGEQTRADRARANLMSPGLIETYDETVNSAAGEPTRVPTSDELSKAADALSNSDFDDLDFSGFTFGDDDDAPNDDEATLTPPATSTSDPIVASLIAEHEDEGFSFGDDGDDDPAIKARKARQARDAAARRARLNQQQGATRHAPAGNAAPTPEDDGPQFGG